MDARAIRTFCVRLSTTLAVAASAVLVPAALSSGAPAASAAGPPTGTVSTPGIPLNVRYGPRVRYAISMTLRNGTRLPIHCQTYGQLVRGFVKTTALWDRLPNGRYVSDAYVDTGSTDLVAPLCATTAPVPVTDPTPVPPFVADAAGPAQQGYREFQVPASVTIAQAILESGWGRSLLTVNDNNYFGIKCGSSGAGPIATGCHDYPTTECDSTGCFPMIASYRVYRSIADSFRDHGRLLATLTRYQAAFQYVHDPDQFIAEVHNAGYATDPAYSAKVVGLMKLYNLYRYDG
ncbi:MAG: sporangiospore maturation cell wall hydrolase GsmA [Actinobacteria bacterium]|nr:sporangiospore maturation cell wall hydrolase GsmA [Actinomycetota bacterium]